MCFVKGILESLNQNIYQFLDSLVVRISACHVEGPGSIPGRGEHFCIFPHHSCISVGKALGFSQGSRVRTHARAVVLCSLIAIDIIPKSLAPRGIEPVTFALLARRSNQLS